MQLTESEKSRFESKINRTDTCWLWTASRNRKGYGQFRLRGKMRKAHRVAFILTGKKIPSGLCVCHSCDVRICVNPDHLWIGTHADNAIDKSQKGRVVSTFGDEHWTRKFPARIKRGQEHHRTKLSDESIRLIRREFSSGKISKAELARKNEVSATHIIRILKGQSR